MRWRHSDSCVLAAAHLDPRPCASCRWCCYSRSARLAAAVVPMTRWPARPVLNSKTCRDPHESANVPLGRCMERNNERGGEGNGVGSAGRRLLALSHSLCSPGIYMSTETETEKQNIFRFRYAFDGRRRLSYAILRARTSLHLRSGLHFRKLLAVLRCRPASALYRVLRSCSVAWHNGPRQVLPAHSRSVPALTLLLRRLK